MTRVHIASIAAAFLFTACDTPPAARMTAPLLSIAPNAIVTTTGTTNTKGIAGAMAAYYDGQIFTINFSELPPGGETANLTHNGSTNNIYQSDQCVDAGKGFTSVIDAIPTDGMNPLWEEVQLVFPTAENCTQFKSDNEVLAAAAAGLVQLKPTGELYRCSVIAKP